MTARLRDVFVYDVGPQLAAMPVALDTPIECEIQLCRTGAFYRADMGHFKVTQRTLEKMVANAIERGVDIPINYYHKGMHEASIEERRSAGRVSPSSLSIRSYKGGFGLFGVARWTAEAATKIKAGEVQYISPEIEWSAVRMAATDQGPAGEPIGPLLSGAALVDDPFFTMNPVTFSRRKEAPKRYSMLSDAKKTNIEKLLKGAGVPSEMLPGLMAQILLEVVTDEAAPPAPEVVEVEAASSPAMPEEAQQSLAASREANSALARRVAELEARDKAREQDAAAQLFERYRGEGRYRVYAVAGADPTGEKKAKELLGKGTAFFRDVFDSIPPLVGTKPPTESAPLARAGQSSTSMAGEDHGLALHDRVMGEIKAKGLKMTDYNRLAAQFSR